MQLEPNSPMNAPRRRLHLLYHELREEPAAYSYVIDAALFRRHLDLYAQMPGSGSSAIPAMTFDDGHVSNLTLAAPLLASRGLTAHFFITAGWTGVRPGYMDRQQLRELHRAGHRIGAHGWSHKLLTHCTAAELEIELARARSTLEDYLGASVTSMSLPGGRANRRVLAACAAAGYAHVYTSVPQLEPTAPGRPIGRLNIRGDAQPEWLAQLFAPSSPLLARLTRSAHVKAAAQSLLGDRLYARIWALANRQEPDAEAEGAPAQDEGHSQ